jgi:predicted ATPase
MLDKITIKGFKSIKGLEDFKLRRMNVLIGANGSGKSNFIKVFKLLNNLIQEELQTFISLEGGADNLLYFGQKVTNELNIKLLFGQNGYEIVLLPAADDILIFKEEKCYFFKGVHVNEYAEYLGKGHKETNIPKYKDMQRVTSFVNKNIRNWIVYHFHDTSSTAKVRLSCDLSDNRVLRKSGENLSAFLYMLKRVHPVNYRNIVDTVKLVAPFFKDFNIEPDLTNPEKVKLEWKHVGTDKYFNANSLSDGTLRFICLATLFLQPQPPETILLDEPELGLHPYAINVLADMMKIAAKKTQIIVSTQSVTFMNHFEVEDIIVVEREDEQSVFRKFDRKDMELWLDDYGLGDLWEKNVLGGRP